MEARRKGRPRPGRSPPSKPSPELTRCRRPVRLERAGLFVCTASRERPAIRDTGSAGWGSGPVEGGSGPEPHPSFIKVFCGAAALALGAGLEEASWPSRLRAPPAGRLAGHGGVGETHSSRDCQGVRPSPPRCSVFLGFCTPPQRDAQSRIRNWLSVALWDEDAAAAAEAGDCGSNRSPGSSTIKHGTPLFTPRL